MILKFNRYSGVIRSATQVLQPAAAIINRRLISTNSNIKLHSKWLQGVKESLDEVSIGFPMNASKAKIKPLHHPHQFYDELIGSIGRAKKTISMSALYLGTGEHERRLLLALDNALAIHPTLTLQLIFDGCRSKRPSPQGTTTLSVLQPLIDKYENRVSLSLFSLPANKNTVFPSPADEVLGVFHMKVFVMDEEVLISGGNLSTEYFVDRQDRYLQFKDVGPLSSYYRELMKKIAGCGEVVSGSIESSSWEQVKTLITKPHTFQNSFEEERSSAALHLEEEGQLIDTWVYPTLQCAPHDVLQDEEMFKLLLSSSTSSCIRQVCLATAYLNPNTWSIELLAKAAPQGKLKVLTAHASSHGFKTARGVMSLIPLCYQHLLCNHIYPAFVNARSSHIEKSSTFSSEEMENRILRKKNDSFSLLAYKRPFWTFHTKGLWVEEGAISSQCQLPSLELEREIEDSPVLAMATIVGSSNYGKRSYGLDLEAQMVILTESRSFMSELNNEWRRLEAHAVKADTETGFTIVEKVKAVLTSIGMNRFL